MSSKIFLPGLNGIRAIAALAVLISHINNRMEYFGLPKKELLDLAGYGVTMFFTLSGFLITFLLLKELEKTGDVAIKKFYMRRVLRIWPLYYLYLLMVICLEGFSSIQWPILFYLLMIPNFKNSFNGIINTVVGTKTTSFMVGHYWSLGVEEQFYAFWPWIVKRGKYLLQILILFPVFYVLLKLALRVFHAPYNVLVFVNYTRFGCLAIGALGAYLYFHHKQKFAFLNHKAIEILAWLFFVVVALNKFHLTSIIDHEIISVFTLIIIFNQVNNEGKIISLENKVFDYLGKISFGLYVYNPLVIYLMSLLYTKMALVNQWYTVPMIYVFVTLAVIAIAHLSYNFYEKPFLKLKTSFTTIHSASSRADLAE